MSDFRMRFRSSSKWSRNDISDSAAMESAEASSANRSPFAICFCQEGCGQKPRSRIASVVIVRTEYTSYFSDIARIRQDEFVAAGVVPTVPTYGGVLRHYVSDKCHPSA